MQDSDQPESVILRSMSTLADGLKTAALGLLPRNKLVESSADNFGSPRLRGLPNLGNTCYMNSALQCLSNTEGFKEMIGKHAHEYSFSESEDSIAKSISALLENIWSSCPSKCTTSENLKFLQKTVGHRANRFSTFMQNDSQEFLAYLLESLREDLNRSILKNSKLQEDIDTSSGANVEIHRKKPQIEDVIGHLYQGGLKTVLTCGNYVCGEETSTSEEFMFLHIPLPEVTELEPKSMKNYLAEDLYPEKHAHLTECLELMTTETLTEKKNWYCERCKKLVELKRKVTIEHTPQILMMHLKRFRVSRYGAPYKLCTHVEYSEVLDLSTFVPEGFQTPCKYDLYAMIDHHGSIHGGHYTATARCDGGWYLFDDDKVEKLDSLKVLKNNRYVYVLFYKNRQSNQSQGKELSLSVSVNDSTNAIDSGES